MLREYQKVLKWRILEHLLSCSLFQARLDVCSVERLILLLRQCVYFCASKASKAHLDVCSVESLILPQNSSIEL